MKRIIAILIGLSLISCSVEFRDNDGETITVEELKAKGKAIANAIEEVNREFDENKDIKSKSGEITKENVTSTIQGADGLRVRHDGETYTIDEYVHIKMEWAYFQGQLEAVNEDIRITKKDGCWVWLASPWNGQSLKNVLYNPECVELTKKVDVPCTDSTSSYYEVTKEINFSEETYDPYDTEY